MSAANIVQAATALLTNALPGCTVLLGMPTNLNDPRVVYLYNDGSTDVYKTTGGTIRRTHVIQIHLLVLVGGDDQQAELDLMALHDTIANLFYTHHTLGGAAATSDLHQRDGTGSSGGQYVLYENAEYRHRWFSLMAAEDLVFSFA